MIITEFRITLPMTVEEYQVGQLFSVAEASLNETGGGEGVEVLCNEPYEGGEPLLGDDFTEGQYTEKIYHLASKVPKVVQWIAPKGSLRIREEAWNAYPYCRTVLTNPSYMKKNFIVKVETYHIADRGESENVHRLSKEQLKKRNVVHIDIANDPVLSVDYKANEDPSKFQSKGGRGPLKADWLKTVTPVMTAYKLVTVEFVWFGLQGKVEQRLVDAQRRLFTKFHRQLFCTIDEWIDLDMDDIRRKEAEVQERLNQKRNEGEVCGTAPDGQAAVTDRDRPAERHTPDPTATTTAAATTTTTTTTTATTTNSAFKLKIHFNCGARPL